MTNQSVLRVPVQLGDGCAISDDIAYVTCFPDAITDEVAFTRLFAFNAATTEKWFHHDLNGHRVVSVCLRRAHGSISRAACALSEEGMVELANTSGQTLEQIPGAGLRTGSRGLGAMRRIREIDQHLLACGAGNQVYLRQTDGWTALDRQLVSLARATPSTLAGGLHASHGILSDDALLALTNDMGGLGGFDDIGGMSLSDLYVCGLAGALWHWNGNDWTRLESPSDDHLHCLHAVSDQRIWVCGHNGTLLLGNRKQGFQSVPGADGSRHYWSVREFGGVVYLGSANGLLTYDNGHLARLLLPRETRPPVVQAIDSTDNVLWVVTDRSIARMNDGKWEIFLHPDNIAT